MHSLKKDYRKLYLLQDKFLKWWADLGLPFYLTGGTALGRFYLNHRYSEDLDFFVNDDPLFLKYIQRIKDEIEKYFRVDLQHALFTDEFSRIFITDDDMDLKIEFVNDVSYRSGNPIPYYFGQLDTPLNILSNKLGAIISREEPKDIFDIVHISVNFSFNWQDVFSDSKKKSVLNEIDVAERLNTFPSFLLGNIDWNTESIDHDHFDSVLRKIANDFLLGRDNSVCSGINPIIDAKPLST
ncbi:MAG TPA: nucleotidyl transferase AbiEii/AbiGii toxin family protein [Bacteroidales bacterium]|nr:nucleotidyl transferase AbiEii/AbiGii toxin family protein [Bacteroidales bacterium]